MAKRKQKKKNLRSRKASLVTGVVLVLFLAVWGIAGEWYVHHSRKWLQHQAQEWPAIVTAPLLLFGNPLADLTDALGITGHDAVYEYDTAAPAGEVFFAGAPRRTSSRAPGDVTIIDRGHFKIGWSNALRHPLWVAYHVTPEFRYDIQTRPSFLKDAALPAAPRSDDYKNSGYDRGHMAPNHAIASRYGKDEQRKTFMMGNIAPQSAALNRGVWRELEHRIADLWTARWGEIWVIVGCIPSKTGKKLPGTDVDVPSHYYQVIVAQEGLDVRMMALIFPQTIPWGAWPARNLITIDELEEMTGLDFNPDLPAFIQDPIESELPSRLWPVRKVDVLTQFLGHYR